MSGSLQSRRSTLVGAAASWGVVAMAAASPVFTGGARAGAAVIASFTGGNGNTPVGGLLIDSAGNLYGATANGGANSAGSLFKLPFGSSTISTLFSFSPANGTSPNAGLL